MSTPDTGDAAIAKEFADQARALLEEQAAAAEQLELPTAEEMLDARAELGANAGRLAVVRHAQEKRRGRPAGARNKRTDDLARYLLGFGQDPAVTMMQIQSTPPELLMEASRRTVTKVVGKGDSARLVTFEETMSYTEAQALRARCAEGILPYIHGKQPVKVDATIRGVRIIEQFGSANDREEIDGGLLRVAGAGEFGGEAA